MSFFDPISFVIGAGVGAGVGGGAIYMLKDRLKVQKKEGEEEAPAGREAVKEFLVPQAGKRYLDEITKFFSQAHLPGKQIDLLDVLVEPRFLRTAPPLLAIEQDEEGVLVETDIYRVIPFVHQFPGSYAAFNLETIALKDLESGDRNIVILGIPGSGKSTALAALGLMALRRLSEADFKSQEENQFNAYPEDEGLSEESRERRRKEREDVQRRAMEQLRVVQRREAEMAKVEARDLAVDFQDLLPIYVHLRHVDLNPAAYGGSIDPAEPLINALTNYVSGMTAQISPPVLYRALQTRKALILIDGYDDLLPLEQEKYVPWLKALLEFYGDNFIIMTGPAMGYDSLLNVGFASSFIAPLNERRFQDLIQKWTTAWKGAVPGDAERRRIYVDNRNRTILDVTMKIWATLNGNIKETGRRGYYESYVRQNLGDIPSAFEILRDMAVHWLNTGQNADHETLLKITAKHLGGGATEETPAAESDGKKAKSKKPVVDTSKANSTLKKLAKVDMLYNTPDGGLAFRHPSLGWYLAGESLKNADQNRLVGLSENWHWALSFATALIDLTPIVIQRLQEVQTQPDLLFSRVLSVADWMPDTPTGTRWKAEILKRMRAVLLSLTQYPAVRELTLAAMVTSRDEGVNYIFREAVRAGNPHIRMLGCLGLGAGGSDQAVADLKPMLVDDVVEVQLAAGLALGAVGNDNALAALGEALTTGDRNLRKAVAEALASISGVGRATLLEGITDPDLEVRWASAFGLARIPETWALVALYRAMLEDSQWSVRNAAETAFSQAREPRRSGPQIYPEPDRYEWLVAWASQRGEPVPEGLNGRQMLMKALQEAPTQIRTESAKALGRLGHVPAVKSLYTGLTDKETEVRIAAFNALAQMSTRFGKPLPGI